MPPPAGQDISAVGDRVPDMGFDLSERRFVDQWSLLHAVIEPVADLELLDPCGQSRGERLVDSILDVKPVGANTGLAAVAILSRDRALDGLVQVCIVEDDERGVP